MQRSALYKKVSEKRLDEEQHQQAAEFGTIDRRPGNGRSSARTDDNVDTVESMLLSQEDKSQSHRTVREISRETGESIDHQFRGLFTKICVSSAARKGALNS